jgi:hypothetical protein
MSEPARDGLRSRKRRGAVLVCQFSALDDLPKRGLTYGRLKAEVIKAGRFSCFEASETPTRAVLFTRLCRDPELVITNLGYPWTGVKWIGPPEPKATAPCPPSSG